MYFIDAEQVLICFFLYIDKQLILNDII